MNDVNIKNTYNPLMNHLIDYNCYMNVASMATLQEQNFTIFIVIASLYTTDLFVLVT